MMTLSDVVKVLEEGGDNEVISNAVHWVTELHESLKSANELIQELMNEQDTVHSEESLATL